MIRNSAGSVYLLSKLFGTKNLKKKTIWIHAASIGEMKIAIEVSRELIKIGHTDILITSNTPTSKTIFDDSKLNNVTHCYLPMDFYFITKKFVKMISSKLLIVIETEIWPNLYSLCEKNNTKILIINARFNAPKGILGILSNKIYKEALNKVTHIYCKSKTDENRYLKYVNQDKVSNLGNIKYSLIKEGHNIERIIDKKYILLASSHHREEIIIIKEWLKLKSNKFLLVIAPRHPNRLGDILSDIPLSGINITIRSKKEKIRNSSQIYIADTLGEMDSLIKYSEFTIFGGSFVDEGGHSFMEAAIHSKAIIVGPYMYNFVEETEDFLKNNALIMCQKPEMLKNIFEKLLRSKSKREIFEKNAKNLVVSKKSIINNYVTRIDRHINI
jgi:3-deoxy-D-manno-octulosonic-acid transferase